MLKLLQCLANCHKVMLDDLGKVSHTSHADLDFPFLLSCSLPSSSSSMQRPSHILKGSLLSVLSLPFLLGIFICPSSVWDVFPISLSTMCQAPFTSCLVYEIFPNLLIYFPSALPCRHWAQAFCFSDFNLTCNNIPDLETTAQSLS